MERSRRIDGTRGAIATLYAASMIIAGGSKFLLLSALLYAPGTILFVMARRERQMPVFTLREAIVFGCIAAAALIGLYGLVSGSVSI
jgi:arginine:ornithine antiporter / lysine permease